MDEFLKDILFNCGLQSPGSWLMSALWLKRAAEEIDYWKHYNADINSTEGDFQFMVPVYKLLLGLSFENLLKGIVVAQRGSGGSGGKIEKDLTTHRIKDLLGLVDLSAVSISDKEKSLLIDLEQYVVWAGRYPLPKKSADLFAKMDSSNDNKNRLALWDRLFTHLKSIGWITKMDVSKLFTGKPVT